MRSADFPRAIGVTASKMRGFKVWCVDISCPQHLESNWRSRQMVKDRRIYTNRQVISLSFVCSCCWNLFSLYTVVLRSLLPTVISPWINSISWTQACVLLLCASSALLFFKPYTDSCRRAEPASGGLVFLFASGDITICCSAMSQWC